MRGSNKFGINIFSKCTYTFLYILVYTIWYGDKHKLCMPIIESLTHKLNCLCSCIIWDSIKTAHDVNFMINWYSKTLEYKIDCTEIRITYMYIVSFFIYLSDFNKLFTYIDIIFSQENL